MKKEVEILKNENSILDSYKIDLETKKKLILKELKEFKKQEAEKVKKPDNKKVKDLVLERVHKPDITLIEIKEDELENTNSTPLYLKERTITRFKRYSPFSYEEVNKFVSDDEDIINEEKKEKVHSIPLAYKDRPITHFKRYTVDEIQNTLEDDYTVIPKQINVSDVENVKEDEAIPIEYVKTLDTNQDLEINEAHSDEIIANNFEAEKEINDLIDLPASSSTPPPPINHPNYPISYKKLVENKKQEQKKYEEDYNQKFGPSNKPKVDNTPKNVFLSTDEALSHISSKMKSRSSYK